MVDTEVSAVALVCEGTLMIVLLEVVGVELEMAVEDTMIELVVTVVVV